jgi:hypothetical protein
MTFSESQSFLLRTALNMDHAIQRSVVDLDAHLSKAAQADLAVIEDLCLWLARGCEIWMDLCHKVRHQHWFHSEPVRDYFDCPYHEVRYEALQLPIQLALGQARGSGDSASGFRWKLNPEKLHQHHLHTQTLLSLLETERQ